MNHHIEAWNHVKKHLFGSVCEVTTKKPWGFKEDRDDIVTKTISDFLSSKDKFDTVLLHILSGEGTSKEIVIDVLKEAYKRAVKVVVLEHNPLSKDFKNLKSLDYIDRYLESNREPFKFENWGRNLLYAFTTLAPLHLPLLSDEYLRENLDKSYIGEKDHGICKNNLIYTHTSEEPIDFEIEKEKPYIWVIGGGIPFESMRRDCYNLLIDSTLKQVLYTAKMYGVDTDKLDRIYKFKPILQDKKNWKPHWRKVKMNGVKPDSIQHINLDDLEVRNYTVYVSTVDRKHWKHLEKENVILEAFTEPRDRIKILDNRK